MTAATPRTVEDYLDLLRTELQGADRALVQDALYDAEEHLRAELAQHPDITEETMLGRIVATYGAPAEVADAYRSNETRVQAALRGGRPAEALRLLDGQARRFPQGALVEERAASRVFALCAAGRQTEARERAAGFLQRYPDSLLGDRVKESCRDR